MNGLRFYIAVVFITASLLACLGGGGYLIDGTSLGVVHAVRGELVRIDNSVDVVSGAEGTTGEFSLKVVNNDLQPMSVIGAESSCSCFEFPSLPLLVPPRSESLLSVRVRFPRSKGRVKRDVLLYFEGAAKDRYATHVWLQTQ